MCRVDDLTMDCSFYFWDCTGGNWGSLSFSLSEKLPMRSFSLEGGQVLRRCYFVFLKRRRDWWTQFWRFPTIFPKHFSAASENLPICIQHIKESENTDIQNKKNLFNKIWKCQYYWSKWGKWLIEKVNKWQYSSKLSSLHNFPFEFQPYLSLLGHPSQTSHGDIYSI